MTGFDDVVQKAYRAKVVIVSPSLLMLAIQVIQQIQKDARMREAADKIHAEVGHLMDDLRRLQDRVLKLQQHFGQANEDVRQILGLGREGREARRQHQGRRVRRRRDEPPVPPPFPRRLEAADDRISAAGLIAALMRWRIATRSAQDMRQAA